MTELKWFLKGKTNIKYLVENGCNIWNGDAYKRYKSVWDYDLDEPLSESDFIEKIKTDDDFARVWGELGPVYGKQWRRIGKRIGSGPTYIVDQIKNLVKLIEENPNSRRLMVNSWNHRVRPNGFTTLSLWIPMLCKRWKTIFNVESKKC